MIKSFGILINHANFQEPKTSYVEMSHGGACESVCQQASYLFLILREVWETLTYLITLFYNFSKLRSLRQHNEGVGKINIFVKKFDFYYF